MKIFLVFLTLFFLLILTSCEQKETYSESSTDSYTSTTDADNTLVLQTKPKYSEVRFVNVQDMKVFNNELYFVTTDKYAGATAPFIYKYVDDKTPPIKLFDFRWEDYRNRLDDLYSLEEYNNELYAGGPLGIFKLDKRSNKFKEAEFSYGFQYSKDFGIGVTLIRAMQGKLYSILSYKTLPTPDDSYGTATTSLAVLEGNSWKLVGEGIFNHGVEDLKEHKGEFYIGGYQGGVEKMRENFWAGIPTNEPYDLGRFTLLESYNGKLYACGESSQYYKGNTYSLESLSIPEEVKTNQYDVKAEWKLALDYKDSCTFIKKANEKLYVGADEWYNPGQEIEKTESIKPLNVFDGKNWKAINFVNAPGLSKGQAVLKATAVEYFNGKLFIAVGTNYNYTFSMQPSFYTLENDETLTPLSWWKE